jgi:hypothetical protein
MAENHAALRSLLKEAAEKLSSPDPSQAKPPAPPRPPSSLQARPVIVGRDRAGVVALQLAGEAFRLAFLNVVS